MNSEEYIKTQSPAVQFFRKWNTEFCKTDLGEKYLNYRFLNSNLPKIDPYFSSENEILLTEQLKLRVVNGKFKFGDNNELLELDEVFKSLKDLIDTFFDLLDSNNNIFKQELLNLEVNHSIIDDYVIFHDYDFKMHLYEFSSVDELKNIVKTLGQCDSEFDSSVLDWNFIPNPENINFRYQTYREEDLLNSTEFLQNLPE